MSINKVIVSGNLTRDPELRQAGATPVLQFGIAVNDRKKNNQTGEWEDVPNFFDVVVWGARGESLSRYLSKGTKVIISGRLKWSCWEADGGKRSKVEIVAEDVEFMSKSDSSYAPPASQPEVLTDDIPF
jgi:single-strand DNA-binding protein